MSNPLSAVREGIWAALDANAALSDFIDAAEGTRYRFGDCDNLPTRIAFDDCPALAVYPLEADIDWETTAGQAILYRIEVRGYTASAKADEIEEFAYLVYAALKAGLPDFGVAAVEAIEFAGPAFGTYRKGGSRFSRFVLGVTSRIHSDISA